MTATVGPASATRASTVRRPRYVAAIVVNVVLLIVANNLLAWEIPFLTDDFARLLWLIDFSLGAAVVVNLAFLFYDPAWFRPLCQLGLDGVSLLVAVRTYQVFPFDFTSYAFDWGVLVRLGLVIAAVGIGIGIVVDLVRLGLASADALGSGNSRSRPE